ncbi:MAG TPA: DUF3048 domain-containing protein [Propionibacteriaceae bacterium]|nr:DUF3048 domain-containing protein [Propionibacteriaceae bacterium]
MVVSRRRLMGGVLGVVGGSLVGGTVAGCSGETIASAPTASGSRAPTQAKPSPTGAGSSSASAPTSATPSASATKARVVWPLTGKPVTDPTLLRHAAVGVKVPDNRNEHPQVGLDKADIVFVELDGYRDAAGNSGTRLLPVFHSSMPDAVGPVRSLRPVDVPLLAPMHAIVGNTGGAGWVLNYVERHDDYVDGLLSYVNTRGTGAYSIDGSRVRTLSGVKYYDRAVLCHPRKLARQSDFTTAPPVPYFPFAANAATASTASGKRATTVRVPWQGDGYAMSYAYDAKSRRYLRSMPWGRHVLANGVRVAPDNVLVIRATQTYEKLVSGRGGVEPVQGIVDGKGSFFYFNGGRGVTGTWTKAAVNQPFSFVLDNGTPLAMAPGQTYVELVAPRAGVRFS